MRRRLDVLSSSLGPITTTPPWIAKEARSPAAGDDDEGGCWELRLSRLAMTVEVGDGRITADSEGLRYIEDKPSQRCEGGVSSRYGADEEGGDDGEAASDMFRAVSSATAASWLG